MQANDYRIIPVNPAVTGLILGEPVYSSLLDLSERVDLVTIFRRSYLTDDLIDAAIAIGASAIWLQIGVINNPGLERAVAAGLLAVQNSCLMVEHSRWSALKS
jgi:predicted CoA-binding protein